MGNASPGTNALAGWALLGYDLISGLKWNRFLVLMLTNSHHWVCFAGQQNNLLEELACPLIQSPKTLPSVPSHQIQPCILIT